MLVRDIMCPDPVCCIPSTSLLNVVKLMTENDCGAIPVLDKGELVGIVTDRDIACRGFLKGVNPISLPVSDVMTRSVVSIEDDDTVEHAVQIMESEQVRRLPVRRGGEIVGIVSQADLVGKLPPAKAGELVREISRSTLMAL